MRCRGHSLQLPVSFCPSPMLGSTNCSHRTPNAENDPPQGLSPSNPPSLSSGSFRCARAHFRTARELCAKHASVRRVSRKHLGGAYTWPVSSRHSVSSRRVLGSRELTTPGWAAVGRELRSDVGLCGPRLTCRILVCRIPYYSFFLRPTRGIIGHNKDGGSRFTMVTGKSFANKLGPYFSSAQGRCLVPPQLRACYFIKAGVYRAI